MVDEVPQNEEISGGRVYRGTKEVNFTIHRSKWNRRVGVQEREVFLRNVDPHEVTVGVKRRKGGC